MAKIQMWVPQGTGFTYNQDGSIGVNPPVGWKYVGTDTNGNPIDASAQTAPAKISCTCSEGTGCLPFSVEGLGVGCIMKKTCTSCEGTTSLASGGIDIASGGYINLSIPPTVITGFNSEPALFEEMFELTEVQNLVTQFLNNAYQGATIPNFIIDLPNNNATVPSGNVIVLANIAGRAMPLPVPSTFAINAGDGASCSCTDGSCKLEKGEVGASLKYCYV